jgi:hypothetical protein
MTVYHYDGSFEGFLCAVADCLEVGESQLEFVRNDGPHMSGLFASDCCEVATVREAAVAFRKRFAVAVSQEAFATARYAFHSQKAGIELLVWRYLTLGLQIGGRMSPHFVGRVGDRPWMIHDLCRHQAALYDLKSWRLIRDIELTAEPTITATEQDYAALWQRYFQRHAIIERHNPKLQQKHVPLRYRKHLTEFKSPRTPL